MGGGIDKLDRRPCHFIVIISYTTNQGRSKSYSQARGDQPCHDLFSTAPRGTPGFCRASGRAQGVVLIKTQAGDNQRLAVARIAKGGANSSMVATRNLIRDARVAPDLYRRRLQRPCSPARAELAHDADLRLGAAQWSLWPQKITCQKCTLDCDVDPVVTNWGHFAC